MLLSPLSLFDVFLGPILFTNPYYRHMMPLHFHCGDETFDEKGGGCVYRVVNVLANDYQS